MEDHGLEIRSGEGLSRVHMGCSHQKGLLYVVPAERSWVCSQQMMPAHALAGFLGELTELQQPAVQMLMNRWGISYRRMPLDSEEVLDSEEAEETGDREGS